MPPRLEGEDRAFLDRLAGEVSARRGELGLTQLDVALQAGVVENTVLNFERCRGSVQFDTALAICRVVGIVIGLVLLRTGVLRYSFADYDEYVKEGEQLAEYPHARREMFWELAFLVPCMAGLVAGWLVGQTLPVVAPPLAVQALGGAFAGYLVGGGLIWGIRIFGTFLFGKEAMGAGDIHLLAAVGAVLGCVAPMWVFFLAPFSGLLWVAVSKGIVSMFTKARRELPYGPHLAVATMVVIGCEPALDWIQANYLPWLSLPCP